MRLRPLFALRPAPDLAEKIAAPPYDVVNAAEARRIAEGNPCCFLRISRAELELPADQDPHAPAVYERAARNFHRFIESGWLVREDRPSLYVYGQIAPDHAQYGLVGLCHADDYERNIIRKHEKTRPEAEDDRTRHTAAINANAGLVFLAVRDEHAALAGRLAAAVEGVTPLYSFIAPEGVRHSVWRIEETDDWVAFFRDIPAAYIADGHHRAASAARVAAQRRAANPAHTGAEEYNWFSAVLFPAPQLRILAYNRLARDLNGRTPEQFLAVLAERAECRATDEPLPAARGEVGLYLAGSWRRLTWREPPPDDPVAALDASLLQDRVLQPLLGIDDPRRSDRLRFCGGHLSPAELARRVDAGEATAAFLLYPADIRDLLDVADRGLIMPPKSTWFDPKLKSGLIIHTLD